MKQPGRNPLRKAKYDPYLFHEYNWGVRKAIRAYDADWPKDYTPELLYYGYTSLRPITNKLCASKGCMNKLKHLRSRLCESCREANYQATKHTPKG